MLVFSTPTLDRVFIEIGPLTIYWYGVIIAVGAGIGLYLAIKEANRLQLQKDLIVDFAIVAIPIAIVAARIYYVLFEWQHYMTDHKWWSMFAIWEGGIAIHGAVIGGVVTAIVYARKRNVSFWQLVDILAPSLILGQAIGRWGNFMNQEAHGGPISDQAFRFLQYLPDFIINQMTIERIIYHPTFLYESLWNVGVFTILIIWRKYNPKRGELFLGYAILYSIGRFFIEGMRTDSLYMFETIRTAQFISILLIVGSFLLILYRRKQITGRYHDVPKKKQRSNKNKTGKKKQKLA